MRHRLRWLLVTVVACTPVATWAVFKPVRVLAPTLLGLHCPSESICIDDLAHLEQASRLRNEAVAFVESRLGPMQKVPRVIFCAHAACAISFGFTSNAAYNVGTSGMVVAPRGWEPYFVRHELIHRSQMEHMGSWHALLFTPTWLIEGMAYSFSEDPRRPLLEPLQGYRAKFESWYTGVRPQNLWAAASAL